MRAIHAALMLAFVTPLAAAPAPAAPTAQLAEQRFDHISITEVGVGAPVVLIPGMSTPRDVWDALVPGLARNHRVILVQVNGFAGDAPGKNAGDGMLDGIVADTHAYLSRAKLGPARVIGHSMGGLVAMKLALAHPADVDRLMVVDALPFFGTVFADAATVDTMRPIAETMRKRMVDARATILARAKTPITKDPGGDMSATAEGRIRIANWSMQADPAVVGQAVYEDMLTDLRQDIARITAPTTVLYNGAAESNAKHYARDYAALPKARLVAVPGSAHFIMLDQPERFAAEVSAFLR